MGFLGGLGNILKGVWNGIGGWKGLVGIGLSMFTGGAGGLLSGALGSISGSGSGFGSLISGFAEKFLGSASSMVSGGGNGVFSNILGSIVGSGEGSSGLLNAAQGLMGAWQNSGQQVDSRTQQAGQDNSNELLARYQADAARQQWLSQQQFNQQFGAQRNNWY